MSALYNLEPQPTAKVVLHTTSGDLLLEVFAKQTPVTSRNFLQHCLNGYYDNTIFHRLVPSFIIQGGDPTGTGHGGESIYPEGPFQDEFHSRLKFNRRGLLGMANGGGKNDNGSQFFLTLAETAGLQGKNTLFGRVAGDTIFNLVKMAEAEIIDGSERPVYPTTVLSTEVLVNPFEDMVVQEKKAKSTVEGNRPERKKASKKKGGKALLSFGDDEGDDGAPVLKATKFNPKLVTAEPNTTVDVTSAKTAAAPGTSGKSPKTGPTDQELPIEAKSSLPTRNPPELKLSKGLTRSPSPSTPSEDSSPEPAASRLERTQAEIASLKASMRRNVPVAPAPEKKKSALERLIPETAIRGRKRKHAGGANGNDDYAIQMLDAFRKQLDTVSEKMGGGDATQAEDAKDGEKSDGPDRAGEELDDEEARLCDLHFIAHCQSCSNWDRDEVEARHEHEADERDDWLTHTLNFDRDRLGKDLNWKKRNEEELMVIDPREKMGRITEGTKGTRVKGKDGGRGWDRGERGFAAGEKRARR
ncbi:MAG: Peptidyl-prolyl isomerase cwc27 [Vezdaea acicularis]|nr:MAG: Peptidyl-prolyl isomerase cwc27 [Vezdaea acicularis]